MLAACTALAGCGSDDDGIGGDATGTATFSVWGEEFIEDEIPAEEVEDGWRVEFDKFLIVLGHVNVADGSKGQGAHLHGTTLYDLKQGRGQVGSAELASGRWDEVSYMVAPADAETKLGNGASQDDLTALVDGGYSIWVEGTATKAGATKTFAWAFADTTHYDRCVTVGEGSETPGFSVPDGGEESVELTIHGDHFLFDDLASADAVLRFDALASADDAGDADGVITLEELANVKLVDIPEGTYGTGAADVNDLRGFIEGQTRSLGHFNGEGHCEAGAGHSE